MAHPVQGGKQDARVVAGRRGRWWWRRRPHLHLCASFCSHHCWDPCTSMLQPHPEPLFFTSFTFCSRLLLPLVLLCCSIDFARPGPTTSSSKWMHSCATLQFSKSTMTQHKTPHAWQWFTRRRARYAAAGLKYHSMNVLVKPLVWVVPPPHHHHQHHAVGAPPQQNKQHHVRCVFA